MTRFTGGEIRSREAKREKDGINWRRVNRVLEGCSWGRRDTCSSEFEDRLSEMQEDFQQSDGKERARSST